MHQAFYLRPCLQVLLYDFTSWVQSIWSAECVVATWNNLQSPKLLVQVVAQAQAQLRDYPSCQRNLISLDLSSCCTCFIFFILLHTSITSISCSRTASGVWPPVSFHLHYFTWMIADSAYNAMWIHTLWYFSYLDQPYSHLVCWILSSMSHFFPYLRERRTSSVSHLQIYKSPCR